MWLHWLCKQSSAAYYHNHQGVWETLGELGKEQQAQIAWLINQKALQSYIERGVPFEYSLKGIEITRDIENEYKVLELIWQGKSEAEIIASLPSDTRFVTRWKELIELYKAGYQKTFDEISNAYILVKP